VVWSKEMAGGRELPAVGPPGPALVWVVDRGEPGEVCAVVEYQPEGGEPILVTQIEVSTSLDAALLYLQWLAPAVLPTGQATAGAQWRVDAPAPVQPHTLLVGTAES
jgi:hypothetical protein